MAHPERDPSTLSNYHAFSLRHTQLDLEVDFGTLKVYGRVLHQLTRCLGTDLVLDVSYLDIHDVVVNDVPARFYVGERVEPLGGSLTIELPEASNLAVEISFSTTDKCTALQFLDKEATDGKKFPYLFSQCQAIHARSLFPCFDTPAVKAPYSLSAISAHPVLMSGRLQKSEKVTKGTKYYFDQPIPIPSYLMSIALGDITHKPIGPRSHVFSEPLRIDACQHEFEADMERFIVAAEKLVFEYEWDQYDALVLPLSFPYGGMENPNITFATPTLISGDRENVDVMAHELAHSWLGNLVTNCSWEHFWLNEGWTVYLERRITGAIHGSATRDFSAIIGWTDLENSIKAMGLSAKRFSRLVQDLKDGTDPDDAFSTVPYEKGSNLLYHIEQTVGGTAKFDPFIPYYFNKFKYKSLDTYQFIDCLYEFFDKELLDKIDWKTWLFEPGLPPVKPNFDTSLADESFSLAERWFHSATRKSLGDFSPQDIVKFLANQSVVFLDTLASYDKLDDFRWKNHLDTLHHMTELYSTYSSSSNAEVLFRWYSLQVTAHNTDFYTKLGEWLGSVGRMKFVRPGYVLLNQVDPDLARQYFKRFESGYHPICRAMVRKDLGL